MFTDFLALDRASVRVDDKDGRLHVAITPISKAGVNPYFGWEIPGWNEETQTHELGLDPNRTYMMFRDPAELEKSLRQVDKNGRPFNTSNGLPLLSRHKPTSSDDHPKHLTVGSTGTDGQFKEGKLWNSIVVWDKEDIDSINSGEKKQLSYGYHYVPVMTPGVWQGKKFDGRMTEIYGNHLALVEEGRAGPDIVVMDSAFRKDRSMKTNDGAAQLLAFAKSKKLIAQDGNLAGLRTLIQLLSEEEQPGKDAVAHVSTEPGGEELPPMPGAEKPPGEAGKPPMGAEPAPTPGTEGGGAPPPGGEAEGGEAEGGGSPADQIKAYLAKCLTPEQLQGLEDLITQIGGGEGEPSEDDGGVEGEMGGTGMDAEEDSGGINREDEAGGLGTKEATGPKSQGAMDEHGRDKRMHKPAMDAAAVKTVVDAAVAAERSKNKALQQALQDVAPWIGDVRIACDSAEEVYRHALKARGLGEQVKAVKDPAALPIILRTLPKLGERRGELTDMAQDSMGPLGDLAAYEKKWGAIDGSAHAWGTDATRR